MIKIDVNIYHNKDYVRTMPKGYIYTYIQPLPPISTRTQKLSIQEHCFWYMPFLVHRWTSTYIYWLSHELSVQGCTSLLNVLQRRKCENNRTKQTINKQISTQFWTRQTIVYVHGKNATLHSIMCKSSVHIYIYV